MTRLPFDSWNIEPLRGPEWPDYKVAPICAVDGCSHFTDHAHHIVRRSFTAGPYSWVRHTEGMTVGNLMPLCWRHHQEVTENRAKVVWDEHSRVFFWEREGEPHVTLAQPPTIEQVRDAPKPDKVQGAQCPSCGQKIRPTYPHQHEEKRPRKTWTITVPNDAREVGAEVLDTLLQSARLILDDKGISYGEDRGVRYFVLATSLGLFVAHAEDIL
jgi:hypothetical protein